MNEREWALFEAVTDLSDETVRSALTAEPKCPKRTLRKIAIAACLAVVLLAGFMIGGNHFGWFTEIKADNPSELEIDLGYSVLKCNMDLPDGYELHIQREYLPRTHEEKALSSGEKERTDYRSPDCNPPPIQIVNSEGKRVFGVVFYGKFKILEVLADFNEEKEHLEQHPGCPTAILEKNAIDKNGNHYLFYRNDYEYPPEIYPEGPVNDIERDYQYVVDITESKYAAFTAIGYGSEEEVRMLYDALNIRFEKDDENIPEEITIRLTGHKQLGEWDGNWDGDWRWPSVDEETALYDGTGGD